MRKYPEYKASGVEWLGKIPSDWSVWKVSRLFKKIGSGTTPKAGTPEYYENGTIPWVNTGDLNDGYINDCSNYITQKAFDDHSTLKIYEKGTLLVAMYGATIGKIAITNFAACTNQACCSLTHSKRIDVKFAFYWFIANKENIINLSYGGGQPNISQDVVRSLKIPICEPSEQYKIVRFLDYKTGQIDSFIANRQKQIELLKEQKAGIINKAVTKGIDSNAKMKDSGIEWIEKIPENWSVWKLKFLTKKISKGTTPSTEGRDILELGAIRYLKAENITPDGISFLPEFFIDEETNQILKRSQLQKNDILFVIAGATIGKASIITEEFIPANTNQAVCFIRLKKIVLPELILHQLQACYIKNKMSVESVVAAQPNISMENIGNFQIFLPPIQEQNILLKYIKEEAANFDTLISKYQKQIDLMTEYRASLISQAVTGKIDVREWEPKREAV